MSYFGVTGLALFWISGDVSSGFQCQIGISYSLCRSECSLHSPGSTSDVTPDNLFDGQLATSAVGSIPLPLEVRLPRLETMNPVLTRELPD